MSFLSILGIGGFLYALPKLLVGSYEPIGTNIAVLDSCTSKSTPQLTCNENSSLLNVAIFFIAQLIMGGGTTPLYTLGRVSFFIYFMHCFILILGQ